jgi:hypothetical protein
MLRSAGWRRYGLIIAITTALGLLVVPALVAHAQPDPTITITAGGNRITNTGVMGLEDVTFTVSGPAGTETCATEADGSCTVTVAPGTYSITQDSAPSDWFLSPILNTRSAFNTAVVNNRYDVVPNVTVAEGAHVDVTVDTPSSGLTTRTSPWAVSRDDPALPPMCGLRVALLFDLSASIGTSTATSPPSNLTLLRRAGVAFVDTLAGTPSRVAVYTFGTYVPATPTPSTSGANDTLNLTSVNGAGATTLTDKINGLSVNTGNFTNWDAGLWQIASANHQQLEATGSPLYNEVIVVTDGDPTRYGDGTPHGQTATGTATRFAEIENGIFSANTLKSDGTRIVAVGVGAGTSSSLQNLESISGTESGDVVHVADFGALTDEMEALAAGNCDGSITVQKEIRTPDGDIVPGPGWLFTATPGSAITSTNPADSRTDGDGFVNFETNVAVGHTIPVTITEEDRTGLGFTLIPQHGLNASCVNSEGHSVTVTNSGTLGFIVDALPEDHVSCLVRNQEPDGDDDFRAQVVVHKFWDINGVTVANGDQDPDFQAALSVTDPAEGAPLTAPTWGETLNGYDIGQEFTINEPHRSIPDGCRVDSIDGLVTDHPLVEGLNEFTVTNHVSCETTLTLVKRISNPVGGLTPPPLSAWTLTATAPDGSAAVHGPGTGATGTVSHNVRFVLAESHVPGWRQSADPGVTIAEGATGSWECLQNLPGRVSGLEDFDGSDGSVRIPIGENVTCAATNEPAATLTLVKRVINHGGTAVPADWTLTANPGAAAPPAPAPSGTSGSSAVTNVVIEAGIPYRLMESGPAGYRLSRLTCAQPDGQPVSLSGNVLTAGFRQAIRCVFTNTQIVPVTG